MTLKSVFAFSARTETNVFSLVSRLVQVNASKQIHPDRSSSKRVPLFTRTETDVFLLVSRLTQTGQR